MPAALFLVCLSVLWAALPVVTSLVRARRRPIPQEPLSSVADDLLAQLRSLPETHEPRRAGHK
jgi:hypothetical protein